MLFYFSTVAGKKSKQMERRLMKDFQIGCVENLLEEVVKSSKGSSKDVFSKLARAMGKKQDSKTNLTGSKVSQDAFGRKKTGADGQGSATMVDETSGRRVSLRRLSHKTLQTFNEINVDDINKLHPQLEKEGKGTKVAFAQWTKSKERVCIVIINYSVDVSMQIK
jgi:transient receptor potential cation channel subfamily C member 4